MRVVSTFSVDLAGLRPIIKLMQTKVSISKVSQDAIDPKYLKQGDVVEFRYTGEKNGHVGVIVHEKGEGTTHFVPLVMKAPAAAACQDKPFGLWPRVTNLHGQFFPFQGTITIESK